MDSVTPVAPVTPETTIYKEGILTMSKRDIINEHYAELRKQREQRLERDYGKRVDFFGKAKVCIHTLASVRCPDGLLECRAGYLDHFQVRERAVIGEPYGLDKNDLQRILDICAKYNLDVDISAELSTHNIGCSTLIAFKRHTGNVAWGIKPKEL